MIIYGSRMYGKKNRVTGWGRCSSCGQYGKHTSYNGRKWGHLYYIPLIPSGPKVRVAKECAKCHQGIHIAETEMAGVVQGMKASVDAALAARAAGETEFPDKDSGEPVNCAAFLTGQVEILCCLDAQEVVHEVLRALQKNEWTYEASLVGGSALEFEEQFDEAALSYKRAAEANPQSPLPLAYLGALYHGRGNFDHAQAVYEKALEMAPEDLGVMQELIGIYEKLNDHARLADIYDRVFQLVPELIEDKKLVKAYKKACKKAGREPRDG